MNEVAFRTVAVVAAACVSASLHSQVPAVDYSQAGVQPGSWGYRTLVAGSEARFMDQTGTIRVILGCTRATRQVTISRTSAAPAATLSVWTSGGSRSLPSVFDQNAMRVSARVSVYDPLLDAIAFSRGRVAIAMPGSPALVLIPGAEAGRVVEDCRR